MPKKHKAKGNQQKPHKRQSFNKNFVKASGMSRARADATPPHDQIE